MPLLEHGFLGAEADKTRQQILEKYADLFGLLKELNAVCHEYLRTVRCDWQRAPVFQAISYFMRGLMTFQSLVILSEHGCIDDVRALCRTLLQACFRLAAIAADPAVVNRIVANAADLDRKRLRFYKSGQLRVPPGMENVDWDAKIAKVHDDKDNPDATEDIEIHLGRTALTVSAVRRVKLPERGAVIRRLEIPHGRFVREIALSGAALKIAESQYLNGCLEVRLVPAEGLE